MALAKSSQSARRPEAHIAAVSTYAAMRAAASVVGHATRLRAANAVARASMRLVRATRAMVFIDPEAIRALDEASAPSREPDVLVVEGSAGRSALHVGATYPAAQSLPGVALRQRRLVSSLGPKGSPDVSGIPALPWPDLLAAVAVPLHRGRRTIGAIAVAFDAPDAVEPLHCRALSDFAPMAAAGLVAASRYEQAVRQAIVDPLTGLLNRAGFERRLREELDRDSRSSMVTGALIVMDLDRFKHVNDTWGHLVGDAVVRIIAVSAIRAQVRSYDVPCRIGGDEFAVILPHTDLHHAVAVAERIRQSVLDAPTELAGVSRGTVGASLGVVSFVAGGVGPVDILARADRLMYVAKRQGGNLVSANGLA